MPFLILNRHSSASAIQNHVLGLEGTAHQSRKSNFGGDSHGETVAISEAILVRVSSSVFEFWPHSDSESPSVDFRGLIQNRIVE